MIHILPMDLNDSWQFDVMKMNFLLGYLAFRYVSIYKYYPLVLQFSYRIARFRLGILYCHIL